MKFLTKHIPTDITEKQCSDTGMAAVFIILLIGFFTDNDFYYKLAIPILLINMIVPKIFYPFAVFWFGLANVLGAVMSKVIMTIAFLLLVTPIGLLRRLLGKDSLRLKQFKKGADTVMKIRNHTYSSKDIEKPY